MPQNITEVDAWTDPLVAHTDGDLVSGANSLAAMQKMGNRFLFLKNRLFGVRTGRNLLVVPRLFATGARFAEVASGEGASPLCITQNSVVSTGGSTDGGEYFIALEKPFPQGTARLSYIDCKIKGGPGHTGTLPQRMPYFALYRQPFGGGNAVLVAGTGGVDASASAGAYEVAHDISLTALNHVWDDGSAYWIRGEGEAGTNAQTDLQIYGFLVGIDPV